MEPASTRRFAFTVQYDGRAYHGWQLQRGHPSVQGELEQVLSRLFDRPVRVLGAGRTDRGVHSLGQVATVDGPADWSPRRLRRAMNALLPEGIWISGIANVAADFHPRYSAISRSYIYRVGLAEVSASPFHAPWCWPLRRPIDMDAILAATSEIEGDHSFRAFAKAGQAERGDRCIVSRAIWREWAPVGVEFHISANRFLHHMVRYLVGTLVEIGLGRRPPEDMRRLLEGAEGFRTSVPAPAAGLFLSRVDYPEGAYVPEPADAPDSAGLPHNLS